MQPLLCKTRLGYIYFLLLFFPNKDTQIRVIAYIRQIYFCFFYFGVLISI